MKKVNVAELLKDCPTGMELDCMIYDDVTFKCIMDKNCYPIQVQTPEGNMLLSQYGSMSLSTHSKCVIFPKGKTTWEGFVPPCKFKDGDIVALDTEKGVQLFIFKEYIYNHDCVKCYMMLDCGGEIDFDVDDYYVERFATEEEKQKLFKVIKDNGYCWNTETKTLEELPKFNVGDRIKHKCEKFRDERTIISYGESGYWTSINDWIDYKNQDDWELVPDKFDISNLKPFDKVLVRTEKFTPAWTIAFYDGYHPNIGGSFRPFGVSCGEYFQQCIPYEGNEHLRGTTNDCDIFYKNW